MHYLKKELLTLLQSDLKIFDFIKNNVLDGLWYWNLENREDEWMDQRFWIMLGYDPSEMPHKVSAWREIIFNEDFEQAFANYEQHAQDPYHTYDQIIRFKHKLGHTIWIKSRGLVIRDDAGTPIRMIGAHTDVTKEKEAELSLSARIKRHNQIIEGANLATWEWDVESDDLKLNTYWAQLLGESENNFEEKKYTYWQDRVHPEDLKNAMNLLKLHLNGKSKIFECEMRLLHADGSWVWTYCKGKAINRNTDGWVTLMTGYQVDITERRNNEAKLKRYKDLLGQTNEVARIGTWEVDLIKSKVTWSKVTRQIHEVPDDYVPDLETGINFYKEGEDRERINVLFNESATKGVKFDAELRIVTAKGNIRWIRSIGIPEFENKELIRIYGVFQDIHERKKSQEETNTLLGLMTNQNERLINFSHIVSHNLRSHTANLNALIRLMDKSLPEINDNAYYDMFKKATANLSETIVHLHEVASMNLNSDKNLEQLNLSEYVEKAKGVVSTKMIEAKGKLTINVDDKMMVKGMPAYLESIILNLLTNAIKYRSPDRVLEVNISATQKEDRIIFAVKDNGLGIDMKKHKNKLFGMYKVFHDNPDSRGIGLFITKSQIEAMQGGIYVESTPNVGSTFTVELKR